jgi:RNA-directed DNA polymerase
MEKGLPHGKHLATGLPVLMRSHSNTLVSVERVTEFNAGRETAGVDGQVALSDEDRTALIERVQREGRSWQPLPVKRTYIPKAGARSKLRPLGIPVIFDRVLQARAKNAVEPEWEARLDARTYGFRPGRGSHDAIEAIFTTLRGKNAKRLWILDADLTAAFDHIDHGPPSRHDRTVPREEQDPGMAQGGRVRAG